MGMYTYLSKEEMEQYTTVPNKDINDLLQEINNRFGLRYLVREITRTEKPLFRKPIVHRYYSVYALHGHLNDISELRQTEEVKSINFAQEHDYSINPYVKASYVITYFLGVLCGADTEKMVSK